VLHPDSGAPAARVGLIVVVVCLVVVCLVVVALGEVVVFDAVVVVAAVVELPVARNTIVARPAIVACQRVG
jgi:hypothetical protein